jgi:ketosteroid isomerase-like protein
MKDRSKEERALRNVLLGSLMATIVAGMPAAALAESLPKQTRIASQSSEGTAHPNEGEKAMSGLSKEQARALIENAVASLLDPRQDAESLSRYFAPDYVQDVDGKRLDFNGFIDHARTLKKSLRRGRATIENIIADGSTIADIHVIDAEMTNGDTIQVKVIAFFTVRDGKIVRVDELTHLLRGTDEDRDLGSRTSHQRPAT